MSDPVKLTAIPLEEATPDQVMQLVDMMSEQKANQKLRSSGHICWMNVPTLTEWERMVRFSKSDQCPQCGKGRIVIEIYHGNMGQGITLKCKWGGGGCGFNEFISDPE